MNPDQIMLWVGFFIALGVMYTLGFATAAFLIRGPYEQNPDEWIMEEEMGWKGDSATVEEIILDDSRLASVVLGFPNSTKQKPH